MIAVWWEFDPWPEWRGDRREMHFERTRRDGDATSNFWLKITLFDFDAHANMYMYVWIWVPAERGGREKCPTSYEISHNYAVYIQNTSNLCLGSSAPTLYPVKICVNRRKICKPFQLRRRRAQHNLSDLHMCGHACKQIALLLWTSAAAAVAVSVNFTIKLINSRKVFRFWRQSNYHKNASLWSIIL